MRTDKLIPARAPGFYTDISDHDYHSMDALGCSEMKVGIRGSMADFRAACDAPPEPPSEAMILGTLAGLAIFRPDEYNRVVVLGPINEKTGEPYGSATKAYREAQERASASGKILLGSNHAEIIPKMVENARRHPIAAKYIAAKGSVEPTAIWEEKAEGQSHICKARADKIVTDAGVIRRVEVKTTTDLSAAAWSRKINDLGYHIQDRWYQRGFSKAMGEKMGPAIFIVMQTEPPYSCAVDVLCPEAGELADSLINEFLVSLSRCKASGEWPGPGWDWKANDGIGGYDIREMDLPRYAYSQFTDGD